MPLLANNFIESYRKQLGYGDLQLSTSACEILSTYKWPGNVRELKNVMERAVVLSRGLKIAEEHLPQEIFFETPQPGLPENTPHSAEGLEDCISRLEIRMINQALQNSDGNKAKAARNLKISERTLWYKLKKYKIHAVNED